MLKFRIAVVALLVATTIAAQSNCAALIPIPNTITNLKGKPFKIEEDRCFIYINRPDLNFAGERVREIVKQCTGVEPIETESEKKATIVLKIDEQIEGDEHYTIEVTSKKIVISGATSAALYYGAMTLRQILMGDVVSTAQREVAPIKIDDAPRFGYRALMLDPARNFLSVEDIKSFIDHMALYKYNVLQIHLTDDQGWRLQIKSHPTLTDSLSYSQTDIKEIIDYASKRHIQVVPEIDIPGHTVAILAAYPELACLHKREAEKIVGKTTNMALCAANEKVYNVFKDILKEVSQLFESPYIHLGGDEVAIPENWEKCQLCNKLMEQKGYTKASQLMKPFFERVLSFVGEFGKKPILWCELNNIYPPADDYLFPYPQDVTLVAWRGGLTPTCLKLTQQSGHSLIMAPGEHAYFDYPQYTNDLPEYNNWGMPITTLQRTYELDPGYGTTPTNHSHVLGVMGTLWAEAIKDINRVNYMAYPRALALAEAGWTQMQNRSWDSFTQRLYPNLMDMMQRGISFRVPFEIEKK